MSTETVVVVVVEAIEKVQETNNECDNRKHQRVHRVQMLFFGGSVL